MCGLVIMISGLYILSGVIGVMMKLIASATFTQYGISCYEKIESLGC